MSIELRKEEASEVRNPATGNVTIYMNKLDVMKVREATGAERDLVPRYYTTSQNIEDYMRKPVNFIVPSLPTAGIEGMRYMSKADAGIFTVVNGEFIPDAPAVLGAQTLHVGEGYDIAQAMAYINNVSGDWLDSPFYSANAENLQVIKWHDRHMVHRKLADGRSTIMTIDPTGDMDLIEVFGNERIKSMTVDRDGYMWVLTQRILGMSTAFEGGECLHESSLYKFEWNQSTFPYTKYRQSSGSFPSKAGMFMTEHNGAILVVSGVIGKYHVDPSAVTITAGSDSTHWKVMVASQYQALKDILDPATYTTCPVQYKNATDPVVTLTYDSFLHCWHFELEGAVEPEVGDVVKYLFAVAQDSVNGDGGTVHVNGIVEGGMWRYEQTSTGFRWNDLSTVLEPFITHDADTTKNYNKQTVSVTSNRFVNNGELAFIGIRGYDHNISDSKMLKFDGEAIVEMVGASDGLTLNKSLIGYEDDLYVWISSVDDGTLLSRRYKKSTGTSTNYGTGRVFIDTVSDPTKKLIWLKREFEPVTNLPYDQFLHLLPSVNGVDGGLGYMTTYNSIFGALAVLLKAQNLGDGANLGLTVASPFSINMTNGERMLFSSGRVVIKTVKDAGWVIIGGDIEIEHNNSTN